MKFPSILKTPRHQRFHFEPRYYDPVKDDLEQRISKIKQEIKNEKEMRIRNGEESRLKGAFSGRSIGYRRSRSGTGLRQFMILIILSGGIFGYLYFGNVALYSLLLILVLYFYLRVRKIF